MIVWVENKNQANTKDSNMLEFISFLSPIDKDILNLIYKANFSVTENSSICRIGKKYFGFLNKAEKQVIICTNNAKKLGGNRRPRIDDSFNPTPIYIRRAFRHEAVHVAQYCNRGETLKILPREKMILNPNKRSALKGSIKVSGTRNREKEYEAYWMEDRPKMVRYALKRYCLY